MTFCAFSSLILAEAMNLVRNSLLSLVGIRDLEYKANVVHNLALSDIERRAQG